MRVQMSSCGCESCDYNFRVLLAELRKVEKRIEWLEPVIMDRLVEFKSAELHKAKQLAGVL